MHYKNIAYRRLWQQSSEILLVIISLKLHVATTNLFPENPFSYMLCQEPQQIPHLRSPLAAGT